MNALVLCAGKGTRLGALTEQTPKPLLPVAGTPLLDRTLFKLQAAGIERILVNMHHAPASFADRITFARGETVQYVPEFTLLGTAGAARAYAGSISPEGAPFLIVYGDVLWDMVDLHRFLESLAHFDAERPAVIGTVWEEECAGKSRLVRALSGRVMSFEEKPGPGPGLSFAGIARLAPAALAELPEGPLDFGHDVFPGWAEAGRLAAVGIAGQPVDIGTPAGYELAQRVVGTPEVLGVPAAGAGS